MYFTIRTLRWNKSSKAREIRPNDDISRVYFVFDYDIRLVSECQSYEHVFNINIDHSEMDPLDKSMYIGLRTQSGNPTPDTVIMDQSQTLFFFFFFGEDFCPSDHWDLSPS